MKKKYNAFKMAGSWIVGGIVLSVALFGLIYGYNCSGDMCGLAFPLLTLPSSFIVMYITRTLVIPSHPFYVLIATGIVIILQTVLGFLIGWGIHSLIRRFRK